MEKAYPHTPQTAANQSCLLPSNEFLTIICTQFTPLQPIQGAQTFSRCVLATLTQMHNCGTLLEACVHRIGRRDERNSAAVAELAAYLVHVADQAAEVNWKGRFLELGGTFRITRTGGPDHHPVFRCEAWLPTPGGTPVEVSSKGNSKRAAQQKAALKALDIAGLAQVAQPLASTAPGTKALAAPKPLQGPKSQVTPRQPLGPVFVSVICLVICLVISNLATTAAVI